MRSAHGQEFDRARLKA